MKSFGKFIGESREESSRPVLDGILDRANKHTEIIEYFEKRLGNDFLEFTIDTLIGKNIEEEFMPRGVGSTRRYKTFIVTKSDVPFYYYMLPDDFEVNECLAIRSTDGTEWWIKLSILDKLDPSIIIDNLLKDF